MEASVRVALAVFLGLGFGIVSQSFQSPQVSNTWIAIGKLQNARAGACSVSLADGRVLITGGESSRGVLSSAEVFDAAPLRSSYAERACAFSSHVFHDIDAGFSFSGGPVV